MESKINKMIAGFLAFIMVISIIPMTVFATEADLEISTFAELQQFAADVNNGNTYEGKTIVLTSDISLGGENSPWTPIGSDKNKFQGTFDGCNHIISGLYINATTTYQGLFGYIGSAGTVTGVTVQGEITTTKNHAAGITAYNEGKIQNCASDVKVTYTGSSSFYHAGIAGENSGTIIGCVNKGNITAFTASGGIVGRNFNGKVSNCYNTGIINSPSGSHVGGIVGQSRQSSASVTNCYNIGSVAGSTNVGAVVGQDQNSGASENYYLSGSTAYGIGSTSNTSGVKTETEMKSADFVTALGSAFKSDDDNINNGYPVLTWQQKVPDLIISTYEQLKSFAEDVNGGNTYKDKLIRLDVNVYLGGDGNPWTPIGNSANKFSGTFDGNYHVVSGLYIGSGSYAGLFGYVNGGTVRNLVVQGNVKGTSYVAGIVGYLNGGSIANCGNQVTAAGSMYVGGVVGYVNGEASVSGCYNFGDITASTGYVGGVIGTFWGKQEGENCYNTGTVTGSATVGGVLGGHKAKTPALKNCYNAGTVVNSGSAANNHGSIIGAKGTADNCYDLSGSEFAGVGGTGAEVNAVSTLYASNLSSAFVDGTPYPVLSWESSVCTDAPVRPAFIESTELSAQLAEYIKAAVNSTKTHAGITGTLLGNEGYMASASSTGTDWMALAMGRFGYYDNGGYYYLIDDGTGYEDYLGAMKAYIEKTYADNDGILHSAKATEWHRAVVAITALGGDPTNFGTYNGTSIDLIADGSYNNVLKAGPGTQGINGWIWGLISMDTGMYAVPADAKYTRETFITEILKMQLTDGVNGNEYGGWVLGGYGSSSDVDITAMAIQALAPYYNDDTVYTYTNENSKKEVSKTVRQSVDEALDRLGAMLNSNGGFASWNTNNVESISQVVVALCSLGINPAEDERFVTSSGKTLLDGILQFRLSDGGFCHVLNGGWNSMANDQATYALVAYWRLENGMRSLYDMRSDWSSEEKAAIEEAITAIDSVSDPSASDYKAQLKAALAVFREVPETERRYVNNYSTLAAAIELVGGEEALNTDSPYITSITVTKNPDKTRYYEGETFDPAGMIVTAIYSNGDTKALTGYKLSVSGELDLTIDTVYITYGVLKTSVSIEVREKMPWDGEGTEDDPYLIKTPDDLVDLRNYISTKNLKTADVYFKMTQDINMKNIDDWRAIADNVTEGFKGHFDGNGYSIWNLNGSTYNCCGLFGRLGNGAVIENLTIASGNLGGSYNTSIGAIAGDVVSGATVTIRNCHNYASVKGTFGIGGILGQVDDKATAIIENCSNHGTITASYTGGGIIGQVGLNRGKSNGAKADIINCYNAGNINGNGSWGLGGIVGSYRLSGADITSTITNCYNVGIVNDAVATGAIFGSIAETTVNLNNVYYLNSANSKVNGVFTDDGSDTEGTVNGEAVSKNDVEMKEEAFVTLLGRTFIKDTENINNGYPILNGQKALGDEAPIRAGIEIGTAEELKAFADRVNTGENFTNKTVLLTAHIDLSDYSNWTPIGMYNSRQFDGIFDGQGYVIDNLYSTSGGLFGYVGTNAVIRNVGVASGEIGASNISFMGGIAKWSNGADIINCWNGADIYCSGYSGGIVGTVRDGGESMIKGCYNIGSVYSSDGAVGGIIGHLSAGGNGTSVNVTVSDCYNAGTITAQDNAGGIVGRAQGGHKIVNCYNVGEVKVTGSNIIDGAGGIVSMMIGNNEIINCYYNSDIITCGVSNGNDSATGKSTEEMKSDELLTLLGDGFKKDLYALVNNGYPIVYWQKTEEAYAIDEVIEKINAIGTVTLDSENTIKEARSAYDALSDTAKELVENYETLVKAEKYLAELKAESDDDDSSDTPKDNQPDIPQTGDNSNIVLYMMLIVSSLYAIAVVTKSRRKA